MPEETRNAMPKSVPIVTLTRRVRFSAAHRYFRPEWDDARNLAVFGDNVRLHGHNYVLEATVEGMVSGITGMAVDIGVLDRELAALGQELGYRDLSTAAPALQGLVPTTENLALLAWERLAGRSTSERLVRVRLYESPELYVEVTAGGVA